MSLGNLSDTHSLFVKTRIVLRQVLIVLRKMLRKINLPILTIIVAIIVGLFYFFSYLFPFTDNAFVITNITPVAADVSGFVTEIYVKNGQRVARNQPIFKVYQVPYRLAYEQASAEYQAGENRVLVLQQQMNQTRSDLAATRAELGKIDYELSLKRQRMVDKAVSTLELKKLYYDQQIVKNNAQSLEHKIEVIAAQVREQTEIVKSLKAQQDIAKINLDLTIVRAPRDGIIDNMYVSLYTPITIHKPIFSFIDTNNFYIQANFDETDLRFVRKGDEAIIVTRLYYFTKVFHGVIVNSLWAAERQTTDPKSQIQVVINENQWLLLPQRFPLQIKILDLDSKYPLHIGASAYVYIKTRR